MSYLDEHESRWRESKRSQRSWYARTMPIKRREIVLGLRDWAGWRETFTTGTRVAHLLVSHLEGVVITYEESNKTHGGPYGDRALVRWPDGSDSLVPNELLVDLSLEEESRGEGDDGVPELHGVDPREVPPQAAQDRTGRVG